MKIQLSISPNMKSVPFDYQQKLIGVIHKWLGDNLIHDKISLYSFSWLLNGKMSSNGIDFPEGATWVISFFENNLLKEIVFRILQSPELFNGMKVKEVEILPDKEFMEREACLFSLSSPVFIKRRQEDGRYRFFTYEDEESARYMTETLKHKMAIAGLPEDETLEVFFDQDYAKKKTKLVAIHGIKNKCSMCPVVVKGAPESIKFAWLVGIGNQTGAGFGSLY